MRSFVMASLVSSGTTRGEPPFVPRSASIASFRIGSSVCMTEYLIAARAAIILWTNLAVMPAEILFDAIEAELERRGEAPS